MARFAKDDDGAVHLISTINNEYTLCGNAFEGNTTELRLGEMEGPGAWQIVMRGPVTCVLCLNEIENCKSVRLKNARAMKD